MPYTDGTVAGIAARARFSLGLSEFVLYLEILRNFGANEAEFECGEGVTINSGFAQLTVIWEYRQQFFTSLLMYKSVKETTTAVI